ncbi:MAG: alkene reductase [Burkholderiaceae bacterium]|jgi:N-ethylmaleimide reductase|nr:alkene reductase [Burkholderiaceae bacterium]
MPVPQKLFEPLRAGALALEHRVVLASLTRMRAEPPGNVPGALMVEYYRQRASRGGLLVSEGSPISDSARGMPATPGIHTEAQIAGWQKVTRAVHDAAGLIVVQLWHVGRIAHSSVQPQHRLPVAPSAIAAQGKVLTAQGSSVPFETPHALSREDIAGIVRDYAQATRNAQRAGFDGVEIHGANGYLIEQFLQSRTNQRTDGYGGSIERRARFALEVTEAVVNAWSADRVGIRLSPLGIANDSGEDDPMPLYTHVIEKLAPLGLAYLHLIEPRASGNGKADVDRPDMPSAAKLFRPLWPGALITAGNFIPDTAEAFVQSGIADAIAFGRYFISNPDLPARIRQGAALTPYNRPTFYSGGANGYTDYPLLDNAAS